MKIRTQFIITTVAFSIIMLVIGAALGITDQRIRRLDQQEVIADNIERQAAELSYLSIDYLFYRESQQRDRWETKFEALANDLASLKPLPPEQQAIVDNIETNQQRLKAVFDDIADAFENTPQGQDTGTIQALVQTSWSRMTVQNQGTFFESLRLSQIIHEDQDRVRQTMTVLILILLGIFGAFIFANYLLTNQRVLKSIKALQAGTSAIASGNLDYTIAVKHNDEIGDLSHAFNWMTTSLKAITASKLELQEEIEKREEAEEELRVSNEQLQENTQRLEIEIDEHQKTEEKLLAANAELNVIYANIPTAIMLVDRDRRVHKVNESAANFSHRQVEEIIGLANGEALRCLHSLDDPRGCGFGSFCENCAIRRSVLDTFDKREPQINVEAMFPFNRENGVEERWLQISTAPIKSETKDMVLLCCEDITDRKKTEQIKDEFIGMVSHELKTPLTVIIGALSVAGLKEVPEEESRQLYQDAIHGAEALADIVDNLLELSRHQANRLVLKTELADIKQIAQNTIQKLRARTTAHQLMVDIPDTVPPVVADPIRIDRIIHNLVENAIKYSPGGEIRIFTSQVDDSLIVGVSDQGPGMAVEDQAKLFQPFQRLEGSNKPGVGLGLRVCRILTEAHGGMIWVESKPGKGSTFFFTLPLAK